MRVRASLLAGICASAISFPAFAQDATGDDLEDPRFSTNVIIVTAQRQNQSLQEVPIAVSAFDSEALEAQRGPGFVRPSTRYAREAAEAGRDVEELCFVFGGASGGDGEPS